MEIPRACTAVPVRWGANDDSQDGSAHKPMTASVPRDVCKAILNFCATSRTAMPAMATSPRMRHRQRRLRVPARTGLVRRDAPGIAPEDAPPESGLLNSVSTAQKRLHGSGDRLGLPLLNKNERCQRIAGPAPQAGEVPDAFGSVQTPWRAGPMRQIMLPCRCSGPVGPSTRAAHPEYAGKNHGYPADPGPHPDNGSHGPRPASDAPCVLNCGHLSC